MNNWRKWIFLPVALLLFLGSVPFFASHAPFKSIVLAIAGTKLGMHIDAEKVEFSWFGPQRFWEITLTSPDIDGKIAHLRSSVPFWRLGSIGKAAEIENGSFSIHPQGAPTSQIDKVFATIAGRMIEASGVTRENNQTGEFSIKGKAAKDDIDLAISANRMPTLLVDRLFDLKGFLTASLGPTFDCTATVTLQKTTGTINLYLTGATASLSTLAAFDETSITLQKPLVATFRLSRDLSEQLLKNVNPLFLTGVQSKTAATLRVSEKGFSFPRPFQIEKLTIREGSIDMGQVRIDNGRSLASLMSFLKGANISNQRQMNAWFTPLSFSLQKGELKTGRMDLLLADSVHLCTWGNIDLTRDQIDMILGVPAETLANAFGLKNLPPNYVMQIPIRGSTKEPDIVTGPAAAKIAATLAAQNIPKKGGAFGTIMNLFNPALLDASENVPPPNRPFPWERR